MHVVSCFAEDVFVKIDHGFRDHSLHVVAPCDSSFSVKDYVKNRIEFDMTVTRVIKLLLDIGFEIFDGERCF